MTRTTPIARGTRALPAALAAATIVAITPPAAAGTEIPKVSANLEQRLERLERDETGTGPRAVQGAGLQASGAGFLADVVLQGFADDLGQRMRAAGARVLALSERRARAALRLPDRAALEAIAALEEVRMIYPAYGYARAEGSVESRAPAALRADSGVTGTAFPPGRGVKVGILSDSFARTSNVRDGDTTPAACEHGTLERSRPQDSDDLPDAVEIVADDASGGRFADGCPDTGTLRPGTLTDEGAAMAELIHDVAPKASIAFHTAGDTPGAFAAGIDRLCEPESAGGVGSDVLVDDILFFSELVYQRGVVAQAAEDCAVGHDTPFYSAAGNFGAQAVRQVFNDAEESNDDANGRTKRPSDGGSIDDRDFHQWRSGSRYLRVEIGVGRTATIVLHWNQPALSSPGNLDNGPQVDFDLLAFREESAQQSGLIRASDQDQRASDPTRGADPFEIIQITNTGSRSLTAYVAADHWAGPQTDIPQDPGTPLELRLLVAGVEEVQQTGDATIYGHPTGAAVTSVGAVPWYDTPAFDTSSGPTNGIDPEPFTALGGELPIQFGRDGSFIDQTTPLLPRLASVDGSNNTFLGSDLREFDGRFGEPDNAPNFFGTSAAAANAAGIGAGLVERTGGAAGGAQIEDVLRATARDVAGQRASAGPDATTGAGLIVADAALAEFPLADAGDDRFEVDPGTGVELDGTGSRTDTSSIQYAWTQLAGPSVALEGTDGAMPAFTMPDTEQTLTFRLLVTDGEGHRAADTVDLTTLAKGASDGDDGGGSLSAGVLVLLAILSGLRVARVCIVCSWGTHAEPPAPGARADPA